MRSAVSAGISRDVLLVAGCRLGGVMMGVSHAVVQR